MLLKPMKEEILSGSIIVSFHKLCRSSYTCKSNNYKFNAKLSINSTVDSPSTSTIRKSSRSLTSAFDIRNNCFVCGQKYKRGDKLTSISYGKEESTRQKVISAAAARQDDLVHLRMLSHTDLFAHGAKYHCNCYSHYISSGNIVSDQKKSKASCETSCYGKALESIVENMQHTVLSENKTDNFVTAEI